MAILQRFFFWVLFLMVSSVASGDVLKVGNRFPNIDFLDANGQLAKFDGHLGKRSVVFVFASW